MLDLLDAAAMHIAAARNFSERGDGQISRKSIEMAIEDLERCLDTTYVVLANDQLTRFAAVEEGAVNPMSYLTPDVMFAKKFYDEEKANVWLESVPHYDVPLTPAKVRINVKFL